MHPCLMYLMFCMCLHLCSMKEWVFCLVLVKLGLYQTKLVSCRGISLHISGFHQRSPSGKTNLVEALMQILALQSVWAPLGSQSYFWIWTNLAQTWKLIYADPNRHWNIENISESWMVLMDFFIYVSHGGKTDKNSFWNISHNNVSCVMVYWNTWKMQCYCSSNKMGENK